MTLSFYSTGVKAQVKLGVEGGYSSNYLLTDLSNRFLTRKTPEGGYLFDVRIDYDINKNMTIFTAPGLVQKNYSFKRTGRYEGLYQSYHNSYIQLPFYFKYKIIEKKLNVYVFSGMFIGYWIKGKVSGAVANILDIFDSVGSNGQINESLRIARYNEKYHFLSERDNRIEWGFSGGLELEYDIKRSISVFSAVKIFQSASDLRKKYTNQVYMYNRTFMFSIGCMKEL